MVTCLISTYCVLFALLGSQPTAHNPSPSRPCLVIVIWRGHHPSCKKISPLPFLFPLFPPLPIGVGRLTHLLNTTLAFMSAADVEVSTQITASSDKKAVLRHTPSKSKGKAPATSPESAVGNQKPLLGIDTRSRSKQSYGTIGDQLSNGGPSHPHTHSPETYRNGHLLFNVPEEVDDDDLEALLEEEGFYFGLCPLRSLDSITHLADVIQDRTAISFEFTPSYPSHPSLRGSS